MFSWLKSDPVKSLQKKFDRISEQAFLAQRNGNIALYSELSKQCEDLQKEIESIKKETKPGTNKV